MVNHARYSEGYLIRSSHWRAIDHRTNHLGFLIMTKHYEIQTYTLDCNDNPIHYRTHAEAMRDLRHYFADCEAAVQDGEICDFEDDLIIVEVNHA
jgi:hypothetical protein